MARLAVEQSEMDAPFLEPDREGDLVTIKEYSPSPPLHEFVRSYHYMEMHLGRGSLLKPVTARPEHMMQFSLRGPFTVIHYESGARFKAPDVVLVGRQTQRNFDLLATGEHANLTVHFQPAGFYRLFHMPMPYMTNHSADAADIVGKHVRSLHQRVGESRSVEEMIGHIEVLLQSRIDSSRPFHPVQTIAQSFLSGRGATNLRGVADASGLSLRQFQRVFVEQVGVRPKLFRRIVRFAEALQSKSEQPQRTWAEVAAHAGYFDQMHFIRDCHAFGGDTPSVLMETWIDCRP